MNAISDKTLLQRFGRNQEEAAFSELVSRHLNFVYSVALRQVQSAHLAEEVAQTAFTELAMAAPKLPLDTVVSAWLFQVTRRRGIDLVRSETRRRAREQKAADFQQMDLQENTWDEIEPFIDEALETLSEPDRNAIILRYFENQSLRGVGQSLGCGEDAAQKRVQRAIKRLRESLNRMKVPVGTAGLVTSLSTQTLQAAPASLAHIIVKKSLLQTAASTSLTALSGATTQTIVMTSLQKVITATIVTVGIGTGMLGLNRAKHWKTSFETQSANHLQSMSALEKELNDAKSSLVNARSEIERLKNNQQEIHRLRADATQYRNELDNLQKLRKSQDEIESQAKTLIDRVHILKTTFENQPDVWIPEMALLTEEDWIQAARHPIETEGELRRSMSEIRNLADSRMTNAIMEGIQAFNKENNRSFPEKMDDLIPYLPATFRDVGLDRWEVVDEKTVKTVKMGGDYIITQKNSVDELFDQKFVVGVNGYGSTDYLSQKNNEILEPVYRAYAAENEGNHPEDPQLYLPYVTHDDQRIALEKRIFRDSVLKPVEK